MALQQMSYLVSRSRATSSRRRRCSTTRSSSRRRGTRPTMRPWSRSRSSCWKRSHSRARRSTSSTASCRRSRWASCSTQARSTSARFKAPTLHTKPLRILRILGKIPTRRAYPRTHTRSTRAKSLVGGRLQPALPHRGWSYVAPVRNREAEDIAGRTISAALAACPK